MPFSSFPFLIFLPTVVIVYALQHRAGISAHWRQAWLLGSSLFFYAYAKPANLPLLIGSITFNWAIARVMMAQSVDKRRKLILWIGLTADITLLFLFKYVNLFLGTLAYFHGPRWTFPDLGFPLGVSFFTLTQIMYLVDAFPRAPASPAARKIFRGLTKPNSLFDHATFVSLFPYVISGPLVRAVSIVPQLPTEKTSDYSLDLAARGLYLFSLGLAKKVILADSFAPIADAGFATIRDFSTIEAWTFCLAALLHLYFDFSGYSDMAVGAAWMLGINIPQNFNAPLRATSIFEFWQRWHISLSNFITDYLYTPMLRAMGKPTLATSAVATILAMTIAALWHGPAWTFVAWGLSHGIALASHQVWKRRKLSMPSWMGWIVTIIFLTSTIVFLRCAELPAAWHMLTRLIPHSHAWSVSALKPFIPFSPLLVLNPITIGVICAFFFKSSMEWALAFQPNYRSALAAAFLVLVSIIYINSAPAKPFIYFGF